MNCYVKSKSMTLLLPLLAAACSGGDGESAAAPQLGAVEATQLDTAVAAQGVAHSPADAGVAIEQHSLHVPTVRRLRAPRQGTEKSSWRPPRCARAGVPRASPRR